MKFSHYCLSTLLLFLVFPAISMAQDDNPDENEDLSVGLNGIKGFHAGFYLGAYFANNANTEIYDGYGIDLNGEKNTFFNSFMYRKIVIENGSSLNGQPDNIATQLKVQAGEWTFEEADMPNSMKYKPAFLLGIHLNYGFSKRESILLNLNFARLTAAGIFTIETIKPGNANQLYPTVNTFPIRGNEQRMMLQLGYNRIFGNNKFVNFFAEAGFCLNYAKVLKNFVQINDLQLDLMSFSNQNGFNYNEPKQYTGVGFGVFGGAGLYIRLSQKYTVKVLYTPSLEKVNIGLNPQSGLQHAVGLRIFYRI